MRKKKSISPEPGFHIFVQVGPNHTVHFKSYSSDARTDLVDRNVIHMIGIIVGALWMIRNDNMETTLG